MEWKEILVLALTVGLPLLSGFVSKLRTDQSQMRDDFTAFQIKVAEEYVRTEHIADIKDALIRIEQLLHTKADKT